MSLPFRYRKNISHLNIIQVLIAITVTWFLIRLVDNLIKLYIQPLVEKPEMVSLEDHVTGRALTGLFTVLGQQEQEIRRDPVARTTDLLKRVFGSK